MRTIVTFKLAEQLFGLDREKVVAMASRNHRKIKTTVKGGVEYLLLSRGRVSRIFDLEQLFGLEQPGTGDMKQLLVVEHGQELLSFLVSARGGIASVREEAGTALPPAFGRAVPMVFPEMLVNGQDAILLFAPENIHRFLVKHTNHRTGRSNAEDIVE
ncbi:chemotaxis protein CheW [Desulfogranum mediterraneum]|uniref:chemotaxis protein CheW n=1 Tax=Desulfogranum mediterraneum TaxID=160661 RepID=UPI0004041E97|nr:chemotaxis protein CheW [Desulfogranum mediterraneum]